MINKMYLIMVLLGVIGWNIYYQFIGKQELLDEYREEIATEFRGKIVNIIQDKDNHPTSTIYLSDGYTFKGKDKYSYGLWIGLDTGDSIYKKANTTYYLRVRPMHDPELDTFKIPKFGD